MPGSRDAEVRAIKKSRKQKKVRKGREEVKKVSKEASKQKSKRKKEKRKKKRYNKKQKNHKTYSKPAWKKNIVYFLHLSELCFSKCIAHILCLKQI